MMIDLEKCVTVVLFRGRRMSIGERRKLEGEEGKGKERERLGRRERENICFNRNLLSFCHGPAINLVGAKCLLVVIALTCVSRGYWVFYDLCVDMLCGASLL